MWILIIYVKYFVDKVDSSFHRKFSVSLDEIVFNIYQIIGIGNEEIC